MSLPGVTLNVLDGNLSIQPGSNEHVVMLVGCCTGLTPNVPYTYGNASTASAAMDGGKLAELAAYVLNVAGGPVQVLPLEPSQVGSASSVTKVGTGAMTATVTFAPHKAITITCTTGGALATAKFTFTLGSGSASQPVTSAAAWSSTGYRVPGTYCTVFFTAGTYTTSDVYTISTAGTIAHAAGSGPAVPTITANPLDDYQVVITVTKAGALATSQFTYSLDGGTSTSQAIVTAGSGVYTIPNTGVVVTFSGTAVSADTYSFGTAAATYASGDLTTALTAIEGTYLSSVQSAMIATTDGSNQSVAQWVTEASALETAALALFNSGVYLRIFNCCPTVGSVFTVSTTYTVDSADTDAVISAAALAVNDPHVFACAGDVELYGPLSGLTLRRNMAWGLVARCAQIEASQNPGAVILGGIPGVASLYRDENATPSLDAARFNTMRTFPGVPGFYVTDFHTMALTTSDYSRGMNARVVDLACGIVRVNAVPLVNTKVPTTTRDGNVGVITEKKSQQIEAQLKGPLLTQLVDTQPQDAVAVAVLVDRVHNILSDGNLIIAVSVQPFAYAHTITANIGMAVAA